MTKHKKEIEKKYKVCESRVGCGSIAVIEIKEIGKFTLSDDILCLCNKHYEEAVKQYFHLYNKDDLQLIFDRTISSL